MHHLNIILNRTKNSVFLSVKSYWNWKVFDLISTSVIWMKPKTIVISLLPSNSTFNIWKYLLGCKSKLLLQLFAIDFGLFILQYNWINISIKISFSFIIHFQKIISKYSLTVSIFTFSKSIILLSHSKILIVINLIII